MFLFLTSNTISKLHYLTSTNLHKPAWIPIVIFSIFAENSLSLFFREEVLQVQAELRFHLKAERASQRSLDIPRMSLFSSLLLSLFLSRLNENVRSR